jgi:hypothetical protein
MRVEVGMKAKGFKFEEREYLGYSPNMDKYIDKIGVIGIIDDRIFSIRFEDGNFWYYPIELAHRALLSVGDKVKIPKTKSCIGYGSVEESSEIKRAKEIGQDYLYYAGERDFKLMLNHVSEDFTGDYFTLEDIELYKENNMKTIKKSELKKIHDVACSTWQGKITALAKRNPWGDDIELLEGEVDDMFAAATLGQTEVLEEVFGKQNKEIDLVSEDINHIVDGLPVFGGGSADQCDVLISLPRDSTDTNRFFLNRNYNWKLDGNSLIVTRK